MDVKFSQYIAHLAELITL